MRCRHASSLQPDISADGDVEHAARNPRTSKSGGPRLWADASLVPCKPGDGAAVPWKEGRRPRQLARSAMLLADPDVPVVAVVGLGLRARASTTAMP